jgi:two-component system cell cycle sensor histidine kinase/response regulator CckA
MMSQLSQRRWRVVLLGALAFALVGGVIGWPLAGVHRAARNLLVRRVTSDIDSTVAELNDWKERRTRDARIAAGVASGFSDLFTCPLPHDDHAAAVEELSSAMALFDRAEGNRELYVIAGDGRQLVPSRRGTMTIPTDGLIDSARAAASSFRAVSIVTVMSDSGPRMVFVAPIVGNPIDALRNPFRPVQVIGAAALIVDPGHQLQSTIGGERRVHRLASTQLVAPIQDARVVLASTRATAIPERTDSASISSPAAVVLRARVPGTPWRLERSVTRRELDAASMAAVRAYLLRMLPVIVVIVAICGAVVLANRRARRRVVVDSQTRIAASEAELRASAEQHRLLFERNPHPMWVFDVETLAFLEVNQAAVAFYGYSRDEFLSMTIKDIRPHADVPGLLDFLRAEPGTRTRGCARHRIKSGDLVEVEVDAGFIRFDGRDARLVAAHNVTDRVRAIEALRESDERFRQMADHVNEAFYVVDLETKRSLYVSPAWAEIWGRPVEDGYDPHVWFNAIHPDDRDAMREGQTRIMKGEPDDRVFRVLRPDGSIRWVHGRSFPVRNADGNVYRMVGLSADITELRHVQEQFTQAQKMQAVGQLAGGIAHDFNNLLTIIQAHAHFLSEGVADDAGNRSDVEEIQRAADRAATLTRQLLAFSRKQMLKPRVIDLNEVVEGVERMLCRLIGDDIELIVDADPQLHLVRADPGQIEQVVMNLAVNARDAMPKGGMLAIRTGTRLLAEPLERDGESIPPGRYAMIQIEDTGVGMTTDVKARAFEPFFTTKDPGQGTGLGLATVYGIVKQSGGYISVDSAPNRGTRITITFPACGESVAQPVARPATTPERASRSTVLVVEDEPDVRRLTRRILERHGHAVLEATTGEHAISVLTEHDGEIDLLLTDMVMPGMNGRAVAHEVAQRSPSTRVLYMSGYTDDEIIRRGLQDPNMALLEKPFSSEQLALAVAKAIGASAER